jgi:hypothetical protein
MEGKNVPQWLPRPVMALIAASVAVFSVCLVALPASAVPGSGGQVPTAATARSTEWWLAELHVTTAWLAAQGSGVTVAVLSDGVDASQPDLGGIVTAGPAPQGAPHAAANFFGATGTGIASLIAGHGHGLGKGEGIIGIAPQARILSVPVTLPAGDPALASPAVARAIPGAIAAGIRYAVKHHASVIDLPIDPGQPDATGAGGDSAAAGGSPAEHAAVNYAISQNVVLVAPAGDDMTTTDAPNYPAAYNGVIAVGSFDSAFMKSPYSSHDRYVTVTGPGEGVTAAANTGFYQVMNSTSAASAVVAGVVALIRSRYPGLSVSQVRKALTSSTVFREACGFSCGSGYGTVDAARAMAAATQIATGNGPRAGTGAQSVAAPAAIPAASSAASLEPRIEKAAAISGAVLVILLLLVWWYVLAGRRKARKQAATAAQWSQRPVQSRYPQAQPKADPMAGYLASPAAPAATEPGSVALLPPRAWDQDRDSAGHHAIGPASRAVNRRPAVVGTPPWEPAPPPGGELPWSGAPASQTAAGGSPWAVTRQPAAAAPRPSADADLDWPATSAPSPGGAPPWAPATSELSSSADSVAPQPVAGRRLTQPALPPGSGSSEPPEFPSAAGSSAPAPLTDSRAGQAADFGWPTSTDSRGPLDDGRGVAEPGLPDSATGLQDGAAGLPNRPVRPSTLAPWGAAPQAHLDDDAGAPGTTGQSSGVDRPRLADRQWLLGGASTGSGAWPAGSGSADSGGWAAAAATADTSSPQASPDAADWDLAEPSDGPRLARQVTAAGLPIRQPRGSSSAQPSPSGSLWERAASRQRDQAGSVPGRHEQGNSLGASSGPGEPGDVPAQQEPRRRPIYVWRPTSSSDGYQRPPTE